MGKFLYYELLYSGELSKLNIPFFLLNKDTHIFTRS